MNRFKVGDRVRVRNDLMINALYDDGCKFIKAMEYMSGEAGEVVGIEEDGRYKIKFDCDGYCYPHRFSDSMLEPINNERFKIGDKVRVKDDLIVDTFYDDGCKFISDMKDTLGKVGEIVKISRNEEYIRYIIKLDSDDDYYYPYCFSKSMLEHITKNNEMEIYKVGDECPYDFLNKFWNNFMNKAWAKIVIINNPEVMIIDKNFNIFTAKCNRNDVFNPEIGFEICYKKKRMDILKNEKEKKAKELASLERMIKNLKENLGEY